MNWNRQWLTHTASMAFAVVLMAGVSIEAAAAQDDQKEQAEKAPGQPAATSESTAKAEETKATSEASAGEKEAKWLDQLAAGYTAAQRDRKPILVRAVGHSCPHCKRLAAEMLDSDVQKELKRWTLVEVDVDSSPADARTLRVGPIPALRLLTPRGKVVVGSDGAAAAADVLSWLKKNYDEAAAVPAAELIAEGTPSTLEVIRVIRQFQQRDATLREVAVRRLLPYPSVAAVSVIGAISEGSLATRLTALELLKEWKAPVAGIDPWQPKTLTDERIKRLADWSLSDKLKALEEGAEQELAGAELKQAAGDIAKMIAAEAPAALAIRERLARHGASLLPEVYRQLEAAKSDVAKQRLTALRYRLVATDRLVLDWPGGLERLAGRDEEARKRAADELARRATAADEPLLLELFSDPAPIVREISLQALQKVGGAGTDGALIRLLKDPDPNVRAAVLKQLTESPSDAVVLKVAEHITDEKDADLVVHGVRVLRQGSAGLTLAALTKLLKHESWRVRAEAAEALEKSIGRSSSVGQGARADTYASLVELLKDEDGFVVSRAINALSGADLVTAVEPMIEAAERHPELAATVVTALSKGTKQGRAAIPHLRKFARHENGQVRAAAVTGLATLTGSSSSKIVRTALKDEESAVRIAAARGLLQILVMRQNGTDRGTVELYEGEDAAEPKKEGGLLSTIFDAFKGDSDKKKPVDEPPSNNDEDKPAVDPQPVPKISEADKEAVGELQWKLLQIRAGKTFLKWQYDTAPVLVKMLSAANVQERLAAAMTLAVLGRDESAIPAIMDLLDSHPEFTTHLASALPWLLRDDRAKLFNRLVETNENAETIGQVMTLLSSTGDPHASKLIWPLLAGDAERFDKRLVPIAQHAMLRAYFGTNYYRPADAPNSKRKAAAADLVEMTETGTTWQQLAALAMLLQFDVDKAAERAAALYETADTAELKGDLFRIQLLALSESEGVALATSVLTGDEIAAAEIGLSLLTQGAASIMTMKSLPITLSANGKSTSSIRSYNDSRPILPEPPKGLKKEEISPLLESEDPAVVAQAGYLLVLLDEPSGLDPLLKYWKDLEPASPEWDRLVYRAIVYIDDADRLDELRIIYSRIDTKNVYDSGIREFYWTIRSMTGRPVLNFRKEIREEIGVDNLR